MLSIYQTRTIYWDRGVSDIDDTQMVSIATALLNIPVFWTELEIGKAQSQIIEHEARRLLIVFDCLNPEDDIQLQILSVQYM